MVVNTGSESVIVTNPPAVSPCVAPAVPQLLNGKRLPNNPPPEGVPPDVDGVPPPVGSTAPFLALCPLFGIVKNYSK